jgi:hypothetical protein
MRLFVVSMALTAPLSASAFCGTYVGQPGSELYSGSSQVVLARAGDQTALTLTNDYQGDLTEFALVIPVPPGVTEDDVSVVDRSVIERVAEYSAPRLVSYTCDDLYPKVRRGGCSGTDAGIRTLSSNDGGAFEGQGSLDVTVEQEFAVGEYEIVILSSETADDLVTWLQNEGYGVSDEAVALFGEYIEGGSQFFAAKVTLQEAPKLAGTNLSPLQVRYESQTLSLPIRLGTLNSPGSQDLIVYGLTDLETGTLGVANYPKVEIAGECLVRAEPEDFGAFYSERLDDAFEGSEAAWALEYSWNSLGCDPCPPGGALDEADIRALGFEGETSHAQFSRLHLRYDADAAIEDVVLYGDGDSWAAKQMRYIQHSDELEGSFPVCGEGYADDPKLCKHQDDAVTASTSPWVLGWGFGGLLLSLGVVFRRKRG